MPRGRRQEQARETRQAFLRVGRELFGELGFAATSIAEIAARTGAARGSLYNHFPSKESLFRAVVEEVESEIALAMFAASGAAGPTGWDRAQAACEAFLDGCAAPNVQRILLFDAPAFAAGGEDDRRKLYQVAERAFEELFRDEAVDLDFAPVANALLGGLDSLARFIAHADDPAAARTRAAAVLADLLAGLRAGAR